MKKLLLRVAGSLLIVFAIASLFKEQLWEFAKEVITADMYVSADTDTFDPGLPIGSAFPYIKARYNGREVYDAGEFLHDKGMIFIANRSVDW
jgi:hypothetical protein